MLLNYATMTSMGEDLENLRFIRQRSDEDEESFKKRLNDAVHFCENVHEEGEKMTFCIDGLLPTTCNIVARFCESQRRNELTFEYRSQFSREEIEAFRARTLQYKPSRKKYYSTRLL